MVVVVTSASQCSRYIYIYINGSHLRKNCHRQQHHTVLCSRTAHTRERVRDALYNAISPLYVYTSVCPSHAVSLSQVVVGWNGEARTNQLTRTSLAHSVSHSTNRLPGLTGLDWAVLRRRPSEPRRQRASVDLSLSPSLHSPGSYIYLQSLVSLSRVRLLRWSKRDGERADSGGERERASARDPPAW